MIGEALNPSQHEKKNGKFKIQTACNLNISAALLNHKCFCKCFCVFNGGDRKARVGLISKQKDVAGGAQHHYSSACLGQNANLIQLARPWRKKGGEQWD